LFWKTQPRIGKKIALKTRYTFLIAALGLASPRQILAASDALVRDAYVMDWKTDGILTPVAIGVFGLGQWASSNLDRYQGGYEKSKLLPWDRPFAGTLNDKADVVSTLLCGAAVAPVAIALLDWHEGLLGRNDVATQILMLSQILGLEAGLNHAARGLAWWPRPLVYNKQENLSDLSNDMASSFYSGHASGAFAAAVFTGVWYDKTHPDNSNSAWVWAGGMTIATSIAALRVVSGQHYPTDVVAGALMGSLIGYAIPKLHENAANKNSTVAFDLAPIPGGAMLLTRF